MLFAILHEESKAPISCWKLSLKRFFIALLIVVLLLPLAILYWLGISPGAISQAGAVGTGLSAKLACSGYFVSGFSDEQNRADIATYSPILDLVDLRHEGNNSIVADINGAERAVARHYPGLGCTLVHPDMPALSDLKVPVLPARSGPWPQGEEVSSIDPEAQQMLQRWMKDDVDAGLDTRALLLVSDGLIVAETYKPGIEVDTPLLGWSMGKSVTAIMLGRMEAQGLVDVAQSALFSAWADEREAISLENLLQMSSGLAFEEPYVPGSDSTRMLFTAPSAAQVALDSPLTHTPGTEFSYSSGTTNLLSRLAWERLGSDSQALLDYFARELAIPLGLGNTIFELDPSGVHVGSSYIYAPARDWARLGQLLLDKGRAGGQQLLPGDWADRATNANTSRNDQRYGYQLWLNGKEGQMRWPDLEPGAYAMMGNRAQIVMMLPQHNALLVRLGWTAGQYPYNERIARVQQLLAVD